MTSGGVYRIGLAASDIDETLLDKSGLNYTKVIPAEAFSSAVKSVVGKPYKRGASVLNDAPDAFDCSALVAWAAVCASASARLKVSCSKRALSASLRR